MLVELAGNYFENLSVALASWAVFMIVTILSGSALPKTLTEKHKILIELLPLWSSVIASASYYATTIVIGLFCSSNMDSEILHFTCSAQLAPSLVQTLIWGIFCGGISTSFNQTKIKPNNAEITHQLTKTIERTKNRLKKFWWTLPILITLAIFLLFYNGYFPLKGDSIEKRGQFGDSFGVLNSLFSGLAFGGLIITLLYQQKQISHQEKESTTKREFEETQHYEEVFYRLLSIYSKTLAEVTNNKGDLVGRQVIRGAIDRAYNSLRTHNVNAISQVTLSKYENKRLSKQEILLLDYVYFRNFKILSVELEKQKRLVETFKLLLRHTARSLPTHLDGEPYFDLIKAQINHTEASYFFLVALTFQDEDDLRELFGETNLFEKIASTKIIRVHEMMYSDFWGIDIRQHKKKQKLPMAGKRIDQAIRAFESSLQDKPSTSLRRYTPAKVKTNAAITMEININELASNEEAFEKK